MNTIQKFFASDARHFQLVYLGSFLLASIFILGQNNFYHCLVVIAGCLATQMLGVHFTTKNYTSWKSALITALGLSLLLKTNGLEISLLAAVIAIGSKFIIRYGDKHIFNPVNIGLVLCIIISENAWISPGQWGSSTLLIFVIGTLAYFVLSKAERLDISICFLFCYGLLLYLKNIVFLDWPMDFLWHQMGNGTLMLFAFFMITDPMTTPNHRKGRILYGMGIAVLSFILSSELYLYTAPIYVLFLISLFTPILDGIWKSKKYEWNSKFKFENKIKKPVTI